MIAAKNKSHWVRFGLGKTYDVTKQKAVQLTHLKSGVSTSGAAEFHYPNNSELGRTIKERL